MIRTIFFAIVAIISLVLAISFSFGTVEHAGLKSFAAFVVCVFSTFASGLIYESFKKDKSFNSVLSFHLGRN